MIAPSAIALRARPTRSSRKRTDLLVALMPVKVLCHFALGLQFCLRVGGEIDVKWRVNRGGGGGGGKRKASSRVLGRSRATRCRLA